MSLSQFKSIDLLLFSLIATIFEVINKFASIKLPAFQLVFMSFTIVLTLISMYRWGLAGVVVMLFSKTIGVVVSDVRGNYQAYIIYVIGGIIGVIIGYLLFQKLIGKKRIKNTALILSYLVFDFMIVMLIESLIFGLFNSNTFGASFTNQLKALLIQESMSIFTSSIILLVANRKNGNILIEMRSYIKDVHDLKKLGGLKEMKESPKFNSDKPFTEFDQIDDSTILDGGTMDVDQLKELEQMYKDNDKISIDNPIDCLAEQEKKDK